MGEGSGECGINLECLVVIRDGAIKFALAVISHSAIGDCAAAGDATSKKAAEMDASVVPGLIKSLPNYLSSGKGRTGGRVDNLMAG